jgi:hypothetical protein
VREMMQRSGVEDAVGPDHIYPSIQDGVDDFLARLPEAGGGDRPATRDT